MKKISDDGVGMAILIGLGFSLPLCISLFSTSGFIFRPMYFAVFSIGVVLLWFLLKVIQKKFGFEVFDLGKELLIRRGQTTAKLALSEIREIAYNVPFGSKKCVIKSTVPTIFGSRIAFFPSGEGSSIFGGNAIVHDLQLRVADCHRNSRAV